MVAQPETGFRQLEKTSEFQDLERLARGGG
jgi:hypothetical protein